MVAVLYRSEHLHHRSLTKLLFTYFSLPSCLSRPPATYPLLYTTRAGGDIFLIAGTLLSAGVPLPVYDG